jgi:excisionase family DNA binding protein
MTTVFASGNDNIHHNTVDFQAFSIDDTAKRLAVSSRHIHRLIKSKRLRSFTVGRRRLIAANDVLDLYFQGVA